MLLSYFITIMSVYLNVCDNYSISSIIDNEKCNSTIFVSMVVMGIFAILYELDRKDNVSLSCIVALLIGIYGLIYFNEDLFIHYIFASLVFLSILFFMNHHSYINRSKFLYFLFYLQIFILCVTIVNMYKQCAILYQETFLIFNFAIFYLYLHYLSEQ